MSDEAPHFVNQNTYVKMRWPGISTVASKFKVWKSGLQPRKSVNKWRKLLHSPPQKCVCQGMELIHRYGTICESASSIQTKIMLSIQMFIGKKKSQIPGYWDECACLSESKNFQKMLVEL